jgi:hypothetical protein
VPEKTGGTDLGDKGKPRPSKRSLARQASEALAKQREAELSEAKRAKAAGEKPPTLTIAARAARARSIFECRARGWSWIETSEYVGLGVAQCENIMRQEGKGVDLLAQDPAEVVSDVLRGYQADRSMYLAVATQAADAGDLRIMMNALTGASQTQSKIIRLLTQLGRLPRDMGVMRQFMDFASIARAMDEYLMLVETGVQPLADAREFLGEIILKLSQGQAPDVPDVVQQSIQASMDEDMDEFLDVEIIE